MFLAKDHKWNNLVFTHIDPRDHGFTGDVQEDVGLSRDPDYNLWVDGRPAPNSCLGVSPDDPRAYRVFQYEAQLKEAGYHRVYGNVVFQDWPDYARRT